MFNPSIPSTNPPPAHWDNLTVQLRSHGKRAFAVKTDLVRLYDENGELSSLGPLCSHLYFWMTDDTIWDGVLVEAEGDDYPTHFEAWDVVGRPTLDFYYRMCLMPSSPRTPVRVAPVMFLKRDERLPNVAGADLVALNPFAPYVEGETDTLFKL